MPNVSLDHVAVTRSTHGLACLVIPFDVGQDIEARLYQAGPGAACSCEQVDGCQPHAVYTTAAIRLAHSQHRYTIASRDLAVCIVLSCRRAEPTQVPCHLSTLPEQQAPRPDDSACE